ncbi:PadR family transcriptional regulator [Actinoallomurus spadix]|uniref:Helix-turn-helix transcriptional regulator n=1 Tax=Actinoallomurus spadix TaxID=79912 RepID=A0ABN0XU35_9ACTN|nr:PadR family transcriptional regulator [Actinoallomurus spadix]MCO5990484.1 PadR family transcriptional regulator [Actinoallomurus spadix]
MSLRHAVLGLLSSGPASGYDLLKIFEVSLANVWPATQSQLYAELGRLADAGFVEVAAEGPRGRKEYAITDAGRAELHHWLTEVEPTGFNRSDMLLRVFFLGVLDAEEARSYLRGRAESADRRHRALTELREVVAQGDDPLSVHGLLALEWGLRFAATQRDWAEWAERELDRIRTPEDRRATAG